VLDFTAIDLRIEWDLLTLEIVEIPPTRRGAAERLPIKIDLEALGGEEALLQGDEIIKPHAFGGDRHRSQAVGHGGSSGTRWSSASRACADAFFNAFRPSRH